MHHMIILFFIFFTTTESHLILDQKKFNFLIITLVFLSKNYYFVLI